MSTSQKKYILANDHGTSGPKPAIVSTTGEVIGWVFKEVPLILPKEGGAEQNPDDWWNAFLEGAKELIDKDLVPVEDIVGVCNTSQWSGTVPVDKDGNNLTNGIIWMDDRGAPYIAELHKTPLKVSGYSLLKLIKWMKITGGLPASSKDPISHILWLKNEKPDIYNKTYKFLDTQDYMNLKLTGKMAASYASIQLHWMTDIRDANNVHYSQKLIKILKVDPAKLPELKSSIDVLGTITKEVSDKLGLNKDTRVVMGAPDLHSATIGSGAVRDFEGHICIGTSDWLTCPVPYKRTSIKYMMASMPAAIPGRYFIANEQEIAGGCLTFLRDKILYHKDELLKEAALPDVYKIFDRIAESAPAGANGLIFTPWLFGERTPVEDHTLRGGIYNISLDSNREDLIRAVFEGVACNINWLLISIEDFLKKKFIDKKVLATRPDLKKARMIMPELNMIGGGAQSNVWCQIIADVLNRKIRQVKDPIQANARGAAYMAAVALGYNNWDAISKNIEISNVFTPNPDNRDTYNKLFKEFLNIYKMTKKFDRRLNK
ncbi:MAG: xylulokinase [Promethearchaeota archaeon]